MPLYNGEMFLAQCIDSVLNQTLKNIELIIIDDMSDDSSSDIYRRYAETDERVKFIRNSTNLGAAKSRNLGISIAQGEFISFIDCDDVYPEISSLELLYTKAKENNVKICGGSLYIIDNDGNITCKTIPNQYFTKEYLCKYEDYQHDGGFYRFIYDRKFLIDNGIAFPRLRKFEDPVFFVKAMITARHFYAVPMYVYAYRKGHKKVIWSAENASDHIAGVFELLDVSKKHSLKDLHWLMAKNFMESERKRMADIPFSRKLHYLLKFISVNNASYIRYGNKRNRMNVRLYKMVRNLFA